MCHIPAPGPLIPIGRFSLHENKHAALEKDGDLKMGGGGPKIRRQSRIIKNVMPECLNVMPELQDRVFRKFLFY